MLNFLDDLCGLVHQSTHNLTSKKSVTTDQFHLVSKDSLPRDVGSKQVNLLDGTLSKQTMRGSEHWLLGGCHITYAGWPRHRENREFGSYFFQTGKTQGILL